MQVLRQKTAVRQWALLLPLTTGILLVWRLIGSSLLLRLNSGDPPGSSMLDMEPKWASTTESLSIRAALLEQLRMNGTSPCHNVRTYGAEVLMVLPPRSSKSEEDGSIHHLDMGSPFAFMLVSVTENGTARCAGGDYYETELVGEHWRSRPAVTDHGNGSYTVKLGMDGWEFPGVYNFTAHLLFDNFHGLDEDSGGWVMKKEVVRMQFEFTRGKGGRPSLPVCKASDMMEGGGGRWRRGWYNRTCEADKEGRYKCLIGEENERCEKRYCEGRVSRLESNGWVYSREGCRFRVWEEEAAWNCLDRKWIMFWGDSNMQDMLRNLLMFVLDYPPPPGATIANWYINPFVEQFFINPRKPDQALHISIVPNLHHSASFLHNHTYQNWLRLHFNQSSFPHFLILNPGLDDQHHHPLSVPQFISHLDTTFHFWHSLLNHHPHHHLPSIVLRTAVTPAGDPRGKPSNPHKMEVFNSLTVERLKSLASSHDLVVVDAFDPTFPFHFDYGYSDGGHYGRSPKYTAWPWLGEPHQYFVEIMLIHMMLTAICDA